MALLVNLTTKKNVPYIITALLVG